MSKITYCHRLPRDIKKERLSKQKQTLKCESFFLLLHVISKKWMKHFISKKFIALLTSIQCFLTLKS
jgi:hypothetical protein